MGKANQTKCNVERSRALLGHLVHPTTSRCWSLKETEGDNKSISNLILKKVTWERMIKLAMKETDCRGPQRNKCG